jgi:hypothetical protein
VVYTTSLPQVLSPRQTCPYLPSVPASLQVLDRVGCVVDCSTSFQTSIFIPRSVSPLFFLKWLYVLLIIVQLLSTSMHVVSLWYVETLEASFSFHSTECPQPSHISDLIRFSGSFHQGKDPCELLLQCEHQKSPPGSLQSVTLTVAPTFVPSVRRAPHLDMVPHVISARDGCLSHSLRSLVSSASAAHTPQM